MSDGSVWVDEERQARTREPERIMSWTSESVVRTKEGVQKGASAVR